VRKYDKMEGRVNMSKRQSGDDKNRMATQNRQKSNAKNTHTQFGYNSTRLIIF